MSRIFVLTCLFPLLFSLLTTPFCNAQPAEEPATTGEPAAAEASAPTPSPEAVAAREAFDAVLPGYQEVQGQIKEIEAKRKTTAGSERDQLDRQLVELRAKAHERIRELAEAGAAVYKTDPIAYPRVNATVMAIAQFYLLGDRGDGGDQYEKALPIVEKMLEAGAGEESSDLYLWGALSAYCTNQFEKADEYFAAAKEAGLLGDNPPVRSTQDPRTAIWQQARRYYDSLEPMRTAWEKEAKIRAAEAETDDLPRVKLTTSKGDVVLELFENEAPESVANFISLVKNGYYDGVVFHRVLPGFMAQGGDPTGSGSGGPGYNIRCECYKPDRRRHFRGSLSMAHAGRDTGGSQFFLTFVPTPFLDDGQSKHTVFGRIIEGMDVAASLKRRDPQSPSPPKPDRIIKAEVLRDRGHAYDFQKLPER